MSAYVLMMLFLFSASPVEQTTVDYVDVIEINNYYGNEGRLTFIQSIFYEWNPASRRHDVLAWRLIKSDQRPQVDWKKDNDGHKYEYVFEDGENNMREIRARQVRVSHTLYDVEMIERDYLLREDRRGLSKAISRKSLHLLGEKDASEGW